MAPTIVAVDDILAQKRSAAYSKEEVLTFLLNGKAHEVKKKIVSGEMEIPELGFTIGEMMTQGSLNQFTEFLRKVTLDVDLGKEATPILYNPIYDLISDSNLPKLIDAKWALEGVVVFTEHIEGQEVKFGRLNAKQGPTAKIGTYTAGFEYTKEMKDFNETFTVEILNKAMGEAWNALLNHMHLYPIISAAYAGANATAWQGEVGDPLWVGYWKTIDQALSDTATAKRPASILLASSANRTTILRALKGGFPLAGTEYPDISGDISAIIFYDGWSVTVGKKTYTYDGVAAGDAYLIRPKRGFKSLRKQDLRIEASSGDITRLIEAQIVGYGYQGVYAALTENVQKIDLTP